MWQASSLLVVKLDGELSESRRCGRHDSGELGPIYEMGSSVNSQAAVNALQNVNI